MKEIKNKSLYLKKYYLHPFGVSCFTRSFLLLLFFFFSQFFFYPQ